MSLEHPKTCITPAQLTALDLGRVDVVQILVRNEKPFDPWDPDVYFQVISGGDVSSLDYDGTKDACVAFLKSLEASLATGEAPVDWPQIDTAEHTIDTQILTIWKRKNSVANKT